MIDAARASLEEQRQIEASDAVPFETFRERYLSPDSLVVNPRGHA
jgi:hypothetical protein